MQVVTLSSKSNVGINAYKTKCQVRGASCKWFLSLKGKEGIVKTIKTLYKILTAGNMFVPQNITSA